MMTTAETPLLVISVEPDSGTRRLFHLILDPLDVRLLAAEAMVSGEFQQMLSDLEREVRRDEAGTPPPAGEEKKGLFINGNLLSDCDPPGLERLQRFRGAGSISAVLEPGIEVRPVPVDFQLDGNLSKPLKPSALLAALSGKADEFSPQGPTAAGVAPPQEGAFGEVGGILEGFESLIAEMDMDRSMIDELTLSYISRGEEYLEHLGHALNDWDEPELDRISHAMKGMSGNLRFFEMTGLCERFHQAAKEGNRVSGEKIFKELESEYRRVRSAIKAKWPPPD